MSRSVSRALFVGILVFQSLFTAATVAKVRSALSGCLVNLADNSEREFAVSLRNLYWAAKSEWNNYQLAEVLATLTSRGYPHSQLLNEIEVILVKKIQFKDIVQPVRLVATLLVDDAQKVSLVSVRAEIESRIKIAAWPTQRVFKDVGGFSDLEGSADVRSRAKDYPELFGISVAYQRISMPRLMFEHYGFEVEFRLARDRRNSATLGLLYRAHCGLDGVKSWITDVASPASGETVAKFPEELRKSYGESVSARRKGKFFRFWHSWKGSVE